MRLGCDPVAARAVAVVLHGRGQSPDWMRTALVEPMDTEGVHFVLPAAPGGSWYDAKAVDPLTDATAEQLDRALGRVGEAIRAAREAGPDLPVALIGFSQGACLVHEYLHRVGPVDAAVALTGCRVGSDDDLPRAELDGVSVYATNGDRDPWIPTPAFLRALGDLVAGRSRVRAEVFPGRNHGICEAEVACVSRLLGNLAASRPVFGVAP